MRRTIAVLLLICLITFSGCGEMPASLDPAANGDGGYTTISSTQFNVVWERIDNQNLLFVLENNSEESVTGFRCGPHFSFAYECQEKQKNGWKTIPCDEGPTVSLILEDLTQVIRSGEKHSFRINLGYWAGSMKKNETYRMLVKIYYGEINRDQALVENPPVMGVLDYYFQY